MSRSLKRVIGLLTVVVVIALSVRVARSDEKPAPTDAQKQQMQQMMEMAKPGPEHERFKAYVGDWDADCSFNCPDGSVQKSKGVMHIKSILGDRYLQLNYEGEMAGMDGKTMMPFKGMGIAGYDRGKKKYTNIWIDELSTGMMHTEGTGDGNVLTLEGQCTDPTSGKAMKVKEVITETDSSHHKYELHMQGPDDKEMMKVLEIEYTKRT